MMKRVFVIASLLIATQALGVITSLRALVDGEPRDTIFQGEPFFIEILCDPFETLDVTMIIDENDDGIIDSTDWWITSGFIWDNMPINPDDVIAFDHDSTPGRFLINFPYTIWPTYFFCVLTDNADSVSVLRIYQAPVDPVLRSISGRVILEGLVPPDSIFRWISVMAYNISHFHLILALLDSMGNFHLNWPFDDMPVNLNVNTFGGEEMGVYIKYVLGYSIDDDVDTVVYVDGHITDVNFYVPLWTADSILFYGEIFATDSAELTIDSVIFVETRWSYGDYVEVRDTVYIDVIDGHFEAMLPLNPEGWLDANYILLTDRLPERYIKRYNPYVFPEHIPYETGDTAYSTTITVLAKNHTHYMRYFSEYSEYSTVRALVHNFNFASEVTLISDSVTEVGVYYDVDNTFYTATPYYEGPFSVPEEFALVEEGDILPSIYREDTVSLYLKYLDATLVCSLLTPTGEIIYDSEPRNLIVRHINTWSTQYYLFTEGIVRTHIVGNRDYQLELMGTRQGWITDTARTVTLSSGINDVDWIMYPEDTCFYLFVELTRESVYDDSLGIMTFSTDKTKRSYNRPFATNRWQRIPITSYFDCVFKIEQKSPWYSPPFMRYIENNGNILVHPGDSLFIIAQLPIDTFTLDFSWDPADTHSRHPIYLTSFYMDYFHPADTTLAYRIELRNDGPLMSAQLPIFENRFLFNITPISETFNLHEFIANHDRYTLVGGPYRPDRISKYLNYGSGEMLLTLEGYPSEYLGADTVYYPKDYFTCIELPDRPENRYYADLFFFKTFPYAHPFGDGSVMAFHDVCDGLWTVRLPDTLPGGFIPEVTETSFFCSDIAIYPDEWNEFPIRISVRAPSGVHGWIKRELNFLEASKMIVRIYSTATDSLVMTKTPWQFFPWDEPSIHVKYFIKETELAPGDYYAVLSYTGWDFFEPFIYPSRIDFSYPGDSLALTDFYIARGKGMVHVDIIGLEPADYEGAFIRLSKDPWGSYPVVPFYDIEAKIPFPAPGEDFSFIVPSYSWVLRPEIMLGIVPDIAETTINTPVSTITLIEHYIVFDYSSVTNDGNIRGRIVRDEFDASPVPFDSLVVQLLSLDGRTIIRQSYVDPTGSFEFASLLAPARVRLNVIYEGDRRVFIGWNDLPLDLDAAETLDVGDIFVDNANARVVVGFHGLNSAQLNLINHINVWTRGKDYTIPISRGAIRDTIFLSNGYWEITPPTGLGFPLLPMDTSLTIGDTLSNFTIIFYNPVGITDSKLPREFAFEAFPNPFNNRVYFRVSLPEAERATIAIFDLSGKRIATISEGVLEAGIHKFSWDGRTGIGGDIPSGVYFYRIETAHKSKTIKGVFLK